MLATPVAHHEAHLLRVGLVQRSIVHDQEVVPFVNQRLDLLPQRRRVGR